jgi:hypothetical protein
VFKVLDEGRYILNTGSPLGGESTGTVLVSKRIVIKGRKESIVRVGSAIFNETRKTKRKGK